MAITIHSRSLRAGHVVIFDDGKELTVTSARYGDDVIGGPNLRTAHALEVIFSNGKLVRTHPAMSVKIRTTPLKTELASAWRGLWAKA